MSLPLRSATILGLLLTLLACSPDVDATCDRLERLFQSSPGAPPFDPARCVESLRLTADADPAVFECYDGCTHRDSLDAVERCTERCVRELSPSLDFDIDRGH